VPQGVQGITVVSIKGALYNKSPCASARIEHLPLDLRNSLTDELTGL